MDIAIAGAGAWVRLDDDGRIADARVALAAVAPTPLFVEQAGLALMGSDGGEDALELAAQAASAAASPITDMRGTVAQRRHLAGVLTKRAARGAIKRARGEEVRGAHQTN
jgi:carbon-monoxide dehydrogenase medium subunit